MIARFLWQRLDCFVEQHMELEMTYMYTGQERGE